LKASIMGRASSQPNHRDLWQLLSRQFALNLQLLNRTLAKSPLVDRYALFGGLLLGLVRDKKPLSGDLDADFYYLDEFDREFSQTIPLLVGAGFQPLYRFRANDGDFWEYSFYKDQAKFEFFRCRAVSDQELHYYDFVPMPPPRQQLKRYINGPLQPFAFLHCQWLAAADLDAALTMHYGDWRTPDRSWRWDRDPLTLKFEPWQYAQEICWRSDSPLAGTRQWDHRIQSATGSLPSGY
jgi:hypothetical protein